VKNNRPAKRIGLSGKDAWPVGKGMTGNVLHAQQEASMTLKFQAPALAAGHRDLVSTDVAAEGPSAPGKAFTRFDSPRARKPR
jgi:hypothetical protein